jgi:putative ABC transport system permease protein
MKTILRNFLSVLRRFKMATALNVAGLSVAFAAFLVIMMQVDYDYNFDRSHPHADRIYRVEAGNVMGIDRLLPVCRPLAEALIASSPHIVSGTFTNLPDRMFFAVESAGGKSSYMETFTTVSPGFADVFTFDMLEGDVRALDDPEKTLIPGSLARKLFHGEPATGRRMETKDRKGKDRSYTVGGVYRDFPRNSSAANIIYSRIPQDENLHEWGMWTSVSRLSGRRISSPACCTTQRPRPVARRC